MSVSAVAKPSWATKRSLAARVKCGWALGFASGLRSEDASTSCMSLRLDDDSKGVPVTGAVDYVMSAAGGRCRAACAMARRSTQ